MSAFPCLLAALLALTALIRVSDGHGCMVEPRFRATLNTNSVTVPDLNLADMPADSCPHCLNGGGKGAVILASNNKWTPWEPLNPKMPFRHDSGLCGDAIRDAAPRAHEVGGKYGPPKSLPFVANYKTGGVIEMTADLTTNHNGYFDFFICDATKCGGDISEACFKNGHCHQLMRVKTPECESQKSRECGPVDPAYPGRWYVPCRKGGHVGEHFMGGKYMRYQLPVGFKSEHAVLQWYWATANSCNPPGFKEYFEKFPMAGWGRCPGDGGSIGGRNPTIASCGGKEFPEEFWMCADVQVTASGTSSKYMQAANRKDADMTASTGMPVSAGGKPPAMIQSKPASTDPPRKLEKRKFKAPSASPSPSPSSTPVSALEVVAQAATMDSKPSPGMEMCAKNWEQCGGTFYKGPTKCCGRHYKCVVTNKYYSQCKKMRS